MPSVMRKRGHPKGHKVTVIGLPAKRPRGKQKHSDQKEIVVPSIKLHSSVKESGSYAAYSVEFRGYVMIPGYFVAKL